MLDSNPKATDSRLPLSRLFDEYEKLAVSGWQNTAVVSQSEGGSILPVKAYYNKSQVDYVVISGIHGTEPAGPIAISNYIEKLIELGGEKAILCMPLLNPWGYLNNIRYGKSGQSVSDSDHLLGRAAAPACEEADAITRFVLDKIAVNPGAAVLDLHEDPVYEAPGYLLEGNGSYLYISGVDCMKKPASERVIESLKKGALPLIADGFTRFNEKLIEGIILNTEDGSIDEMLYKLRACTPVITVENILHAPCDPPLAVRVEVYQNVLDAFFGVS